jgi:hypothetical protein
MRSAVYPALAVLGLVACSPAGVTGPAPGVGDAPAEAAPAAVTPAATPPTDAALLLGEWVSTEDEKYSVEITADGKYNEYYDGTADADAAITWVSACADAVPGGTGPYLLVTSADLERCFVLVSVDAEMLELMYVPRGNTLSFTRK